jgi:hypothetical protein
MPASVKGGRLTLAPVTLTEARRIVATLHRHNKPPHGWLFGTSIERDGERVGVAVVSHPRAAAYQGHRIVEIIRVATDGSKNANSKLYGAACRMAAAGGYVAAITYTLESESGASLRAAGFVPEAVLAERDWAEESGRDRYSENLFGEKTSPEGRRIRWRRRLADPAHINPVAA